MFGYYGGEGFH